MIKQTTIEKIKKYTKLRGATDPRLREDILIDVYTNASNKERVLYNQEMDRSLVGYFSINTYRMGVV